MSALERTNGQRAVLVTGAAQGIGCGIARHFAARGDAVLLADIDAQRGGELEAAIVNEGGRAAFLETDVRDEASVQRAIGWVDRTWRRLDVLCNNAGVEGSDRADRVSLEQWNRIEETNLRGAFFCSKHAFRLLEKTRGCIVNIASVQGVASERNTAPYAATKGGLLALTRGMALDFAHAGVRVNAICPGAIHSGMMESYLAQEADREAVVAAMSGVIPLGFLGRPEHIAGVAYFLASAEAAYITGASIAADGGLLARLAL